MRSEEIEPKIYLYLYLYILVVNLCDVVSRTRYLVLRGALVNRTYMVYIKTYMFNDFY